MLLYPADSDVGREHVGIYERGKGEFVNWKSAFVGILLILL